MAALHARVREEIAQRIARGAVGADGRLPPERELSASLGVSRETVRRALEELARDGLVYAVRGRGTFAAPPRVAEPPDALLSFHELAASRGLRPGARPLRAQVRPATLDEAELLGVAPGAEVFDLERLRTLDDVPVAVDESLVPLRAAPGLPGCDWSSASLYAELRAAGCAPVRADYAVEAQPADARLAGLLGLERGAPLLVAQSRTYTADGRMVEAGRIAYRGDRYRFRSTLLARPAAEPGARGAAVGAARS